MIPVRNAAVKGGGVAEFWDSWRTPLGGSQALGIERRTRLEHTTPKPLEEMQHAEGSVVGMVQNDREPGFRKAASRLWEHAAAGLSWWCLGSVAPQRGNTRAPETGKSPGCLAATGKTCYCIRTSSK